jgi:hypothetical protein
MTKWWKMIKKINWNHDKKKSWAKDDGNKLKILEKGKRK